MLAVLAPMMALLTGCPGLPLPDRLDFATSPRIFRGDYEGLVDTREAPFHMALSGDASTLAISWPGATEVYDLPSLALATTIDPHTTDDALLSGLALDRTGALVAGIVGRRVRVWDGRDGSTRLDFDPGARLGTCQYCGPQRLALAPDAHVLAVAGDAPVVLLVDPLTGAVNQELDVRGEQAGLVAFDSSGALLASASFNVDSGGTSYFLRVWDTGTLEVTFEQEGSLGHARTPQFGFSADGSRLAVGSDADVRLFDLAGGAATLPYPEPGSWFRALSPDGSLVTTEVPAGRYTTIEVIDVSTREALASFPHAARSFSEWSADGSHLVVDTKLVRASDMTVAADLARGHLYRLVLRAEPTYVDPTRYDVAGTVSVDGGAEVAFTGRVTGNETQRYLAPQMRPPLPATLRLELADRPWLLVGWQHGHSGGITDEEAAAWTGYMREDASYEAQLVWNQFDLWRVR